MKSGSTVGSRKSTGGLSVVKNKAAATSKLSVPGHQSKSLQQHKPVEAKVVGFSSAQLSQFILSDQDERLKELDDLLLAASTTNESDARKLGQIIAHFRITSLEGSRILTFVQEHMESSSQYKENALAITKSMLSSLAQGSEPIILPLVPTILLFHCDKSNNVRTASAECLLKFVADIMCPHVTRVLLPMLVEAMGNEDWRVKVGALNALKAVAPRVSPQISPLLPIIIPKVSECIYDSKKQVQVAGSAAMLEACAAITNEDIKPLVPQLVNVIANPDESVKTLNLLLETTFVQNVDAPVLALIAPLLGKSLKNRSSAMKRKASKVIDIMCRLVQDPADVAPFEDMLLPWLDKVIDELVDAEVCEVATAARAVLLKALGEGNLIAATAAATTVSSDLQPESDPEKLHPQGQQQQVAGINAAKLDTATVEREVLSSLIELVDPQQGVETEVCQHIATVCANLIVYGTELSPQVDLKAIGNAPAVSKITIRRDGEESTTAPISTAPVSNTEEVEAENWRLQVAMTSHVDWKLCTVPYLSALLQPTGRSRSSTCVSTGGSVGAGMDGAAGEEKGPITASTAAAVADADLTTDRIMGAGTSGGGGGGGGARTISLLLRKAVLGVVPDSTGDEEDETATNLCNIEFSLAFGGKILLHNTHLKLGRGRKYGIMGKNGAGKTTLLTNIGSGNIEGLPLDMKTVYVQHDDASDDQGVSVIDELMSSPQIATAGIPVDAAITALKDIKFTDAMLQSPRSALSGGWKMKLLIVKAMLVEPDVLLLDEPTNHLDADSVQWLVDYLQSLTDVTCMIVSHDTAFMDKVLTDVIHYENKKLVYYHGNLTHFVKLHPEAKYYYELEGSTLKFIFPTPGRLEGINSNTRAIIKADNVSFTYPGAAHPTLRNATVKVCLGSRIAVVGANGAGKSTLIKMLVGETEPDEGCGGTVWKHRNLRIAYVAQHSFHHVEQHLDESPVDYMKWRFHGGVDREDMSRLGADKKPTEEEVEERVEKKYGDIDQVLGRRKNGRTMEYECTFIGQNPVREPNKYYSLEKMTEMGLLKLCQQVDAKVAAMAAGLDMRPLLTAEIQGHLDDFNLEADFGTHGTIRRLSGGQKVKLVLAAAMWNRPHVIVLDEPTNYLDREALGALTQAIKDFAGGVVIISHNKEFTDALCNETWSVEGGQVDTKGGIDEAKAASKVKMSSGVKKSGSNADLEKSGKEIEPSLVPTSTGNINKIKDNEIILNPRTLEALSKKQMRLLERCATAAGVTPKEYASKITCKSPEWKWL